MLARGVRYESTKRALGEKRGSTEAQHVEVWTTYLLAFGPSCPSSLPTKDVHDCGLALDGDKHAPNIFRLGLAARTRLHNTEHGHLTMAVPQPTFPHSCYSDSASCDFKMDLKAIIIDEEQKVQDEVLKALLSDKLFNEFDPAFWASASGHVFAEKAFPILAKCHLGKELGEVIQGHE